MKLHFFALFALLFVFNCKKNDPTAALPSTEISPNVRYEESAELLYLKSGKFSYEIKKKSLPFKKVMLLNASLLGYFSALHAEETITGITSPEYIYSEKIHQLIAAKKIENIGNEQKYDVEKIISLKPDAIFTNYVASFENTYDLLQKNGIKVIFFNEYLEQNPLEKSKYLLVFGKLLGKEENAKKTFAEIEKNYLVYKNLAAHSRSKPQVLANEIYGNQWFMAGGKSNLAQFIKDANGAYILKHNKEANSVPMSFEEVFAKSEHAEYWVNVGNHQTKKELLQINPNYSKMKVFNQGKLYSLTQKEKAKANDYFESGVVRADLVLKDYIKIFHPEIFPNEDFTYMKELK